MADWSYDSTNKRVYNSDYANDDLIIGSNQKDDAGGTDRDMRLFFGKAKGSFRAGQVTGTQWNNTNVGDNSAALGLDCKASGAQAFAAGNGNTAAGVTATAIGDGVVANGDGSLAMGSGTIAQASYSAAFNTSTNATGYGSIAVGYGATASRQMQFARGVALSGVAQVNGFCAYHTTTTATPSVMMFDPGGGAGDINLTGAFVTVLTIPASKAHRFTINAVARRTDTPGTFAGWTITGTAVRSSSGSARFISTPTVVSDKDAGASTWDLAVSIDTSNSTTNYLAITATGQTGATIKWVADIVTAEAG